MSTLKASESELNSEFAMKASGSAMHSLLSKAVPVDADRDVDTADRSLYYNYNNNYNNNNNNNNNGNNYKNSNIAKYSIQFQGCNQIKHWNKDADDEDDVRISTKRLVRFRLVPFAKCSVYNPWVDRSGIQAARNMIGQADYGDYLVDMNTFVEAYLEMQSEALNGGDDDNGNKYAVVDDDTFAGFALDDYAQCAAFDYDFSAGDYANNDVQYYLGPYCALNGGEIRLNLFQDDSCTTVARCNGGATRGDNCFTQATGRTIPYTSSSIVSDPCIPCSENYSYLSSMPTSEIDDDYDFGYPRDSCATLYDLAGKCEKTMKNGKYDYGCTYIQGIKIGVSQQGYAVAVKRSMGADAAVATLAISCTFMGMYVYYLRYVLKKVGVQKYKKEFYVPSHTLS